MQESRAPGRLPAKAHAPTPVPTRTLPRVPSWVVDALATLFIVGVAVMPFGSDEFRPSTPFAFVLVLAPAVLLPFRRRWPVLVLVATLAIYGATALTGTLSPGVVLAAAIAMYSVATQSTRRRAIITAACAVLGIALLSLFAALGTVFDPRAIQFAVTLAFAAAAGDATRSRREYIIAITERAERAEQSREAEARRRVTEERLRIARDLHDAVAHQISVISLSAGVASTSLRSSPERAEDALLTIRGAARSVLAEIGDLLAVLRADDAPGATAAPQPGLERLDALVESFAEAGLQVNVRSEGQMQHVAGATSLVAYRVIQEALTNAHKHGAENRAHVLLALTDTELSVIVTNPVSGPVAKETSDHTTDGHDARASGGLGLLGLRERVASVRGSVTTGTAAGGYRVAVTIPRQDRPHSSARGELV